MVLGRVTNGTEQASTLTAFPGASPLQTRTSFSANAQRSLWVLGDCLVS